MTFYDTNEKKKLMTCISAEKYVSEIYCIPSMISLEIEFACL